MNNQVKGNNPVLAVNSLFQGLKLVSHPDLRKFVIVPVLINFILYSVAIGLGYYYLSDLINPFIPEWLSWLNWIIWPLFFISCSVVLFFTFTLLANLLAAPFYSQLATKTLSLISDQPSPSEDSPVNQVIWSEVKRIGYLVGWMIPLLILFIIPGINLIAPILWGLFSAWGMGLEFMAYPSEHKGLLFSEQKQVAKQRRLSVLSFGGLVVLGLSIPVLNLIVAPAAVIGATIYIHQVSEK